MAQITGILRLNSRERAAPAVRIAGGRRPSTKEVLMNHGIPRIALLGVVLAILVAAVFPAPAEAQLGRLRNAAKNALQSEIEFQIDRLVREAVRCAIHDPACYYEASSAGEEVIFYDTNEDDIIVNDDGVPITDREVAAERAGIDLSADANGSPNGGQAVPGEGVWANYDFVPGDRVLAATDFTDDKVGDFPRELEYMRGNMEIVEWNGTRLLRATSVSLFKVLLPDGVVPEQFTVEFDVYGPGGSEAILLTEEPPANGQPRVAHFNFGYWRGSGLMETWHTPLSSIEELRMRDQIVTARIMVDDRHVRVYVNETRIANVPVVELTRGDAIYFVLVARQDKPLYIAEIRIAEGGRDLYDKLAEEGRVATRGVLFDVNSDRILPESTPTLDEIGDMLQEHAELRIVIEGHTDATGEADSNQELSERRAQAVRRFLIEHYGIDADRLVAEGFGESKPVDSNDTPEGRQNNRRVELVRREAS